MEDNFNWFVINGNIERFERHLKKSEIKKALQIGVYSGNATLWLVNNLECEVWDVDAWEWKWSNVREMEALYDERINSLPTKLKHLVLKIKARSQDALKLLTKDSFCFVFVDADHSEEAVYNDGTLSWPLVKVGGIMCFDDYQLKNNGGACKKGIDRFLLTIAGQYEIIEQGWDLWLRKIEVL